MLLKLTNLKNTRENNHIAKCMFDRASITYELGKKREAPALYRQALELYMETLGKKTDLKSSL